MPPTVASEVRTALAVSGQVVVLESVAFAHGFRPPEGYQLALACMEAVRAVGAVPALAYVHHGRSVLESDRDAVAEFLQSDAIRKLSPRDLGDAVHRGQSGALTIGATIAVAARAGARVVATGGLGGVHFGFAETLDISSDLYQLAASPVILVAAGIKPVLDVRATVEVLETLSVPTLGWHTDEVPTFYRRTGGPPVSSHVETAPDVAAVAAAHWALDLGGLLLLRPPDSEVDIEESLRKGLAAAGHQGVQGSDVTPFLLRWLDQETDEQTVEPHRQLLLGNARLAAEVAVALKPEAS